jgi:predicted O-methyltransferase YrrM
MPYDLARNVAAVPRELLALLRLPRRVLWFYSRALLGAVRRRDRWTLTSATRPHELAKLLSVAENSTRVVELGTGTGWAAVSLALADSRRRVVTYDPNIQPHRDFYLGLVDEETRRRVDVRHDVGEAGPARGEEVELVFIDSSHSSTVAVASFVAWEPAVVGGGIVAFHDYGNPSYPGVKEAVEELGLEGELFGNLWIWRKES